MTTHKRRFAKRTTEPRPHGPDSADDTPVTNWLFPFHLPRLSQSFAIKFLALCALLTTLQIGLEYRHIHQALQTRIEHRVETVAENFRLLSDTDKLFSIDQAKRLADRTVNAPDNVDQIFFIGPKHQIVAFASSREENSIEDPRGLIEEPGIRSAISQSFKNGESRHLDIVHNAIPLHSHIVPLPRLGVSMVEMINLNVMQQEIFDTVTKSAMGRIGIVLALLIMIFILMRHTVLSPLLKLAHAINSSRQNGSYKSPSDMPPNEIGDLARTFAEVFDELNYSHTENERLAQVANGTHAGVLIADTAGRIIWVNASFTQKTGYGASEIVGCTPSEMQEKGYSIGAIKTLDRAVHSGLGCNVEMYNQGHSGKPYWSTVEVRPIRGSTDEIKSFIVIETDITEFKNAENALKKSQEQLQERVRELQETRTALEDKSRKLDQTAKELASAKNEAERASRVKSDFLATMSHEIRTPMNGVIGISDILLQGNLNERQREQVELIKESGENLLTIINAILDHSKLEAGHFELENDDCSPREVTRYVVDLLQKSAKEKGLALNCKVADDVPSFFLCDNKRLRQILINLVGNAIKFTTIGAINLDVFLNSATDSPDTNIIFAVRDTGVGIPDAVLPRLFKRYKQADASTARTHGGTGLGLVISRDLATLMGGNIEVVSVQGIGTTFSLVLPMREATTSADSQKKEIMRQAAASETSAVPTKPKAETAPAPAKASKLRVLLAEDQPVNQKLMKAVMEQMGHDLTIANNGIEAVKAVRNFPFDLILMDIQMPELDGILATKIIRSADEDWRTIPIIAVTAHAMENHKQTYFAAGMNGFVSKPFRMDALVAEIERVLRNAHESPPTMEIAGGSLRQTDEDLKISTNKEQALTDILNELDFLNT